MKETVNIFWFRRDLRLDDNHALFEALKGNDPVLPIFIFDTEILEKLPKGVFLQLLDNSYTEPRNFFWQIVFF